MVGLSQQLPVECLAAVQAPMVGISDLPFRLLCSKWGVTLTYTAMFHADPLLDNPDFRDRVLRDLEYGRQVSGTPLVVAQLAGNVPERVVDAGKIVARYVDALELNLGCPQQRAKEGRYGAYLLHKKDMSLVHSIVQGMTTLPLPIHTKFRLPPQPITAAAYAVHLAAAGSSVVTLHARPAGSVNRRRDLYGLQTDAVGEVRTALTDEGWRELRVVGNGGVRTLEDVGRLTKENGVEGWMVGEHLAGNFRFFNPTHPNPRALDLAAEYLDLVDDYPAIVPLQTVQRHLRNFVEFDPLSAHTRERKGFLKDLEACNDFQGIRRLCEDEWIRDAWSAKV